MSVRPTFPQMTGDSIADLRAKLSATTLALHETLDSVMAAFDRHTQELDLLRRALTDAESALKATSPQVAAVVKSMPMLPELPKHLDPLPKLAIPSMPPLPAPAPVPVPAARQQALAPQMTQILWPSKDNAAVLTPPTPPAAPMPTPVAAKADLPMLISAPAPMQPPAPPSPDLEQATLEELNAALAYAFSQVSNTTSLGKGAVTQMMPAPLPSQAMRFGNASEVQNRF